MARARRFTSIRAAALLQNGPNVLAVGAWNMNAGSSDLVIVPKLVADPELVVLRGPYLQVGTPTSIVVRWRTNVPVPSRVLYGPAPDELTEEVEDPAFVTEHVVTLTDLEPDTTYHYAIGTVSEILAGGDGETFFVTSPLPGTPKRTRIWILGDSGTADANDCRHRKVQSASVTPTPGKSASQPPRPVATSTGR